MKIWYILRQSTLMVYGDLGEAIYRWYGPDATLRWVSGCDLQYFHSKCMASEDGRQVRNYEWNEDLARKEVFGHFKMYQDCKGYQKFIDSNFFNTLHNREEFYAEFYSGDPHDIFGNEWCEWVPELGNIIPMRCQSHLIGLKMAFGKYT